MFLIFFTCIIFIVVVNSEQNATNYSGDDASRLIMPSSSRNNMMMPVHNQTYIEKAENMIRMPLINKYDEHKNRRNTKKAPKRIVQKIIKKNRARSRKFYVYHVTSRPTMKPIDPDNMYMQDEQSWKDDSSTTQSHQKKKSRKWNSKLPRYPMPYQKFQFKKDSSHKRSKRDVRDDIYIFKDLDEMEFLNKKDDYDVVNAHVKKYW